MKHISAVALTLALTGCPFFATSADSPSRDELEEVVVVGHLPGPPLWKISRGEHVLWILPLIDLYPKKMTWDTTRVEAIVGRSEEYISPPMVANGFATANPFLLARIFGLYKTMVRLPDKKTLADVLPPNIYQRFSILKARNFPMNSDIDKSTVSTAASGMQGEILKKENLGGIWMSSAKWLRANKTMLRTKISVGTVQAISGKELKALIKAMKELQATPAYARMELACFEGILEFYERDLASLKRRANAWANGRVDDLMDPMPLYGERIDCLDVFSASVDLPEMQTFVKEFPRFSAPHMAEMRMESTERWLDAAERALSRNVTTFSMLNVSDIVDKEGLVAQLEARGYKVEISAR